MNKTSYNNQVTHIIQSWEWGEFRKKLGLPLYRSDYFEITFHKIPFTPFSFGYLPKGPFPDKKLADDLEKIAKENKLVAIKIEPNILTIKKLPEIDPRFKPSPKSLFTKYNFVIDLTKSEDELLKNMHQKTRYNIKIAQKHNVQIETRTDDQAFEEYLNLYFDTTKRQKYHGHNETYHRLAWKTLREAGLARILIAYYTPPETKQKIPLTAWMLLNFRDTLYYPYGGSSPEYRNTMSSTLLAWEAIKLGKKMRLKKFDLWGALGPNPNPNHPWYGFHHFKEGLGGELVEYIGTYDIIFNPLIYHLFNLVDRFTSLKVFLLKLLNK